MGSIFACISNFLSAAGAALGWGKQRDAEKNTPAMQSAASAAAEQKQKDAAASAVATENISKIRDELSE